jgi:membrane associated rhomboid family serine protease
MLRNWLANLERHLRWITIPHLTLILVLGQVLFFLALRAQPNMIQRMVLVPADVLAGEPWRLLTFMFIPPTDNVIFIIFALYLFWLMGSALEAEWGEFRYTLYILIGWLGTAGAAFLVPTEPATNAYVLASVFLAFAMLYPDFTILLFFILPVKVKWLALLTGGIYVFMFATGDLMTKVLITAALANFLLFFAGDIVRRVRGGAKRMSQQQAAIRAKSEPFHVCCASGWTDKSHPDKEFRYVKVDGETRCYCVDHLPEQFKK